MTKKVLDQNMSYKEELLNSIEPNFIFSKKPINRFKSQRAEYDNKNVEKSAQQLVYSRKISDEVVVLGPVEAPINLLKGQYRYRNLLKGNSRKKLKVFTKKMINSNKIPSTVRVVIDVDPYTFM